MGSTQVEKQCNSGGTTSISLFTELLLTTKLMIMFQAASELRRLLRLLMLSRLSLDSSCDCVSTWLLLWLLVRTCLKFSLISRSSSRIRSFVCCSTVRWIFSAEATNFSASSFTSFGVWLRLLLLVRLLRWRLRWSRREFECLREWERERDRE